MKKRILIYVATIVVLLGGTLLGMYFYYQNHIPNKVWLHRCDTLGKLNEKGGLYSGIEVDVCLRPDGRFDVTHDADTTFNLDIHPYFTFLKAHPKSQMWLDVKNLDPENQAWALDSLKSMCQVNGVQPSRLNVESSHWQLLEAFKKEGFHTSCYVDAEYPSRLSDEQCDSVVASLRPVVESHKVDALSFPGWWYSRMKEAYGESDIEFWTWRHRDILLELEIYPIGRRMLNDPQVKVILIKDKGHYHR